MADLPENGFPIGISGDIADQILEINEGLFYSLSEPIAELRSLKRGLQNFIHRIVHNIWTIHIYPDSPAKTCLAKHFKSDLDRLNSLITDLYARHQAVYGKIKEISFGDLTAHLFRRLENCLNFANQVILHTWLTVILVVFELHQRAAADSLTPDYTENLQVILEFAHNAFDSQNAYDQMKVGLAELMARRLKDPAPPGMTQYLQNIGALLQFHPPDGMGQIREFLLMV